MNRALFAFCWGALALAAPTPKPKVEFKTTLGSFIIELEPKAAPLTVENFLKYVRKGQYKGTTFHRVKKTFMVQGGGFLPNGAKKSVEKAIQNEADKAKAAGLLNKRGTVAMARLDDPNSATAQFFVNVVDNPFLDFKGKKTNDDWGYCVFGRVIKGMGTVDKIKNVPLQPDGSTPKTPVLIEEATELTGIDKPTAAPPKKGK